ncbi:hypothetical protein [Stenotrophomonas sp. PS02289]|uniref:hypothetical protein n=1 Tax=Stenotrophomonas sp. PS02289 TaxID=2991422 RepID=UPI00249BBA42|nr:hypothetical protein [Stenotrophomonas sp. PS02289]
MTHPIATPADWQNHPLPERHVTVALDFSLDALESESVRRGFIPWEMEDKWFHYFANDTLYMHRSWTGFCVAQVHFVPDGEGLRAVRADLNRDPDQYSTNDDEGDIKLITGMIRRLRDYQEYLAERKAEDAAWRKKMENKPL